MLLFILTLLSCTDYTMIGKPAEQDILVFPEVLDFGDLDAGHETGLEQFTVINSGQTDLIINTPVLVSGDERFSLGDVPDQEWIIPPQGNIIFDVSYVPETFEQNGGVIEVSSDDPDEPLKTVELTGKGNAPVMTVTPLEFDYGDISIGCDNEERITITNDGNMDLIVESVTQMVTQPADIIMEMGSMPNPPWTIPPGQSLDFLVSYIPLDVGPDESQIEIKSNDPYTPEIQTIQHGDGDVEQWFAETHIQEEIPVLDVLWVVDDSGSMYKFQSNLSSNIGYFVQAFIATGADYHMAVVTTTHSMIGNIIDRTTPDPERAIAMEIMVGIGGSGMETGIQKSYEALSSASSAGPGSSFFREGATLVVVYVSDEQDWGNPWSSYINFFDGLKPSGQFVPYAIIGDPPSGCSNSAAGGSAQYGSGYWDLVDYYGGDWYSICATNWGVQLQTMANQMAGRSAYQLTERDPIEETISVTVNGQVVTEWEYDPNTNSVIFHVDHVPDPGQTIEISYAGWGC